MYLYCVLKISCYFELKENSVSGSPFLDHKISYLYFWNDVNQLKGLRIIKIQALACFQESYRCLFICSIQYIISCFLSHYNMLDLMHVVSIKIMNHFSRFLVAVQGLCFDLPDQFMPNSVTSLTNWTRKRFDTIYRGEKIWIINEWKNTKHCTCPLLVKYRFMIGRGSE